MTDTERFELYKTHMNKVLKSMEDAERSIHLSLYYDEFYQGAWSDNRFKSWFLKQMKAKRLYTFPLRPNVCAQGPLLFKHKGSYWVALDSESYIEKVELNKEVINY